MIAFLLLSALLVAGALLFLLPPLLLRQPGKLLRNPRDAVKVTIYRDQLAELEDDLRDDTVSAEQCELSRRELQQRLLEDVPARRKTCRGTGGGEQGDPGC